MLKKLLSYFFIISVLFLASCENSEKEINDLSRKSVMKDEAVKVEAFLTQGGKIKARLTAPVMVRLSEDTVTTEFPKSLHVDFYSENKVIESRLDSKYGKYFETIGKVYLRDSVMVVSVKGDTLICKDLWWDQNKQIFYTEKEALYWAPGKRLVGKDGLHATQDLKTVSFLNNYGKLPVKEGEIPR